MPEQSKDTGMCPHGNFPDTCQKCPTVYTIENDHHPEIVEGGKGIKRLERLHVKEDLASPEKRINLFAHSTNEQFKKLIGYINSVTRGKKISYEFKDGQVPMGDTPSLEEKGPIMNEAFSAVREILSKEEMPPQEALRLAAITLAGAINYIHPAENGNGRTGRLVHYLIEFGSERGADVFEHEMSALIAKIPLYKNDRAQVIYNTPPPELEYSLAKFCSAHDAAYKTLQPREKAAARVRTFLSMMKGDIVVPILDKVPINRRLYESDESKLQIIKAGDIDGRKLYIESYMAHSTAPNRQPSEIPKDAVLNKNKRAEATTSKDTFSLSIDLV